MSRGEREKRLELMTFDLDLESYFVFFSVQAIPFEWLYLATSFSVLEIRLQNI